MNNFDIDLLALRGFCVLMDERSVSRAASRLGVRQPAMSRLLGRLRDYFADPLLVWTGGSMVPTPRALSLKSDIRQVLETMERLSTPAQTFDPMSTKTKIVVAATGLLESVFLTCVMKAVAAQAPAVRVDVRVPDRLRDIAALERGEIDFIVGWTMTPAPSLRSRLLFTDKLVCIARTSHPKLRDDNDLTYAMYVELPQIQYDIPGRTTTEILLQERLLKDGHHQNIKYHVQNSLTVADVVANSDVIATLPYRLAARLQAYCPLKIFELPFGIPQIKNRAYWHECKHADVRSRWFRGLMAEVGRGI
jgi:DNA-binding transcriptional LysR family regulator